MKQNAAEVYLSRWSKKSDTYKTMRSALNRLAGVLGFNDADDCPWGSLRNERVRSVAAALADEGLKPPTINKLLSALRGVLETSWRLGGIPDKEYRRIKIENVAGRSLPAGRALEAAEVDVVFEKLCEIPPRDAAIVAVLAGCGLRRVEAVRLRREDYDTQAGELRALGKGNKERLISVPPRWRPYIETWRRSLEAGSYMFPAVGGKSISRSTVSYIVDSFVAKIGIANCTPHDFRRTFITRVSEKSDIAIAQRLAGHASINTTTIYDRRGKAAEKKAVEDL